MATIPDHERAQPGLVALNGLTPQAARRELLGCCGSERWAERMERGRPYASLDALLDQAGKAFGALTRQDWLQALAAHARVGAPRAADERGVVEQAGVTCAGAGDLAALRAGNQRYEAKFGHVFLIRASGRDAGQLLASLNERLGNPADLELEIACGQQREITRLRLHGLLAT